MLVLCFLFVCLFVSLPQKNGRSLGRGYSFLGKIKVDFWGLCFWDWILVYCPGYLQTSGLNYLPVSAFSIVGTTMATTMSTRHLCLSILMSAPWHSPSADDPSWKRMPHSPVVSSHPHLSLHTQPYFLFWMVLSSLFMHRSSTGSKNTFSNPPLL